MAAKKTKKSSSKAGYDLAVSMLQRNPNVEYGDVKAAADKKGVSIYPIVYGRAKAALGLVAVAKRGQGKAKRAAAKREAAKRGPGRGAVRRTTGRGPRRATATAGMSGIESIVAQIKDTERERDRAIQALAKIRDIIDSAM